MKHRNVLGFLTIFGPGLVVMFADTDAGSVITAAQSGAVWGYKLLLLQLVLIPVVYMVQELAVRLGLVTGKGHGELIREYFGKGWAWLSVSTLMVACLGALVTEFAGVAGAGLLFGIPPWLSVGMAILLPIVLGFLYMLALKALPVPYRLHGAYSVAVGMVVAIISILGVYAALSPFF